MPELIVPVQLPGLLDAVPLVWGPWDIAPVMSHVPFDCEHCAFDGQPALAMANSPEKRGRWMATRCRRCQATRVTTHQSDPPPFGSRVEVWSGPPQPYQSSEPEVTS